MNVTTATVEAADSWTMKGSGSHSKVKASTAYSANDMQMIANCNENADNCHYNCITSAKIKAATFIIIVIII